MREPTAYIPTLSRTAGGTGPDGRDEQVIALTRKFAVMRKALWAARDRLLIHGDLSEHSVIAEIDAALAGK